MPTQHVILEQIVSKMPQWVKKHMQEHPRKYASVDQVWVSLKEEEVSRMPRSSTGNIHVLTTIPHDRETHVSTLKMTEVILVDEAEHVDAAAPVAFGYGDVSALLPLGLHFLGQQLPRGPKGEFECLHCGDARWYRKCNATASLKELAGQHATTWSRVTPVVGNKPGTPPITQAPSMSSVGPVVIPDHRPVTGASGACVEAVSTVQCGPLQALARSMIDLQHRVAGLHRDPSPVPSLSPPLLSLGSTRADAFGQCP
jgi:hypothetical protein